MHGIDVKQLIAVVQDAGDKIMEVYETDFTVETKEDESPLTAADKASHTVIQSRLAQLYPDIPILSEEGKHLSYDERKHWERFWLVDPLDGTKEFVKRNGDFTVNIALIEQGVPVLGVVSVPVEGIVYVGVSGEGAYKIDREGTKEPIHVQFALDDALTLVESRSHPSPELESLLVKLQTRFSDIRRIQRGSSLKICAVAEGSAHIYPRMGPTMEWDTAAGQAVVEAAGGLMLKLDGTRLTYNKENLKNDYFIVVSDQRITADM